MAAAKRATKRVPTKKPVRRVTAKKPVRRMAKKQKPSLRRIPSKSAKSSITPAAPVEVAPPVDRRSATMIVRCASGLFVLGDALSIDEAWEQKRHAQLSGQFFVDFHGPLADELTAQHRENREWSTLEDGTIRIPVRGAIEAEQMVSAARRTIEQTSGENDTTVKATSIELTLLHVEDATRDANRAGTVHGLQAIAVALPRGPVDVLVFVDAEGQPDEIRIKVR